MSLQLALVPLLLCAAPKALPSPASLKGVLFYDEGFVASVHDEDLTARGWPALEFSSPGVVVVSDGENERLTFTAKKSADGFELAARDERGQPTKRFWRWLDEDRAVTNLWGSERIASKRSPTPGERRDAAGERLASARLPAGAYSAGKQLAFEVVDGGVRWPKGRRTFFECQSECTPDAGSFLCLRDGEREHLFVPVDGGFEGRPVRQVDACGARKWTDGGGITLQRR